MWTWRWAGHSRKSISEQCYQEKCLTGSRKVKKLDMNKDGKTFLKTCVKYSDAAVSHLCNEKNIPSWFSTLKSKASHLRSNLCVRKRFFFSRFITQSKKGCNLSLDTVPICTQRPSQLSRRCYDVPSSIVVMLLLLFKPHLEILERACTHAEYCQLSSACAL